MRAQLFEKMEEIVEYTTKLSYPMTIATANENFVATR